MKDCEKGKRWTPFATLICRQGWKAGRDWKVACPSRQTDRPGSFGKGWYCGRGRKGKFKTRLLLGSMIAVAIPLSRYR